MKNTTILFAEDHTLFRQSVTLMIHSFGGYEVIAQAANGEEVIEHFKKGKIPQILLLDLSMPKLNGVDTAKHICKNYPQVNILVITMYDTQVMFERLVEIGVKGIIKKNCEFSEMKRALSVVSRSEHYFPVPHLFRIADHKRFHLKNNTLTDVEIIFLKFCATDKSYKEIADEMKMTQSKIDHIRDALFQKLEIQNRAGLTLFAVKNGLAALDLVE